MRRILILAVAAGGLLAGPAHAGPSNNQHFLFATEDQCTQYLWAIFRGNHAYYCQLTPDGWYITEDFTYKDWRKSPNK